MNKYYYSIDFCAHTLLAWHLSSLTTRAPIHSSPTLNLPIQT